MTLEMRRRTFVKGGAAMAMGLGTAAMAGGTAGAFADEAVEAKSVWDLGEVGEPAETIETPVLIIGGGGAGMAAAIQCVELGVTPTIVEAQGFLSGAFIGTEFIDGVGSQEQLAYEADDSVDLALNEHMHYHHYIPPRDLCARFIGMIPENVEWLKEQGVEFSIAAGYKSRALMYKFEEGHLAGEQFVATFVKRVEELGVNIMTDTRARKLVQDGDGAVTGAIVETKDGSFVQINAGAVILATGGYGNNPEFLDEVSPHEAQVIDVIGMPYRRADGIKMAVAAGARTTEGLSATMWLGPSIIGAVPPEWQQDSYSVGVQPALWFNQDCKRFINEDIFEANFSGAGNSVRNQTKSYMLFTEEQMIDWETNGSWVMCFSFGAPGKPMNKAREMIQDLPSVHVGDDLAALAEEVGLDPEALTTCVERYNELCEVAATADPEDTTADADFHKKAMHMHAIGDGPYWLCETAACLATTVGGLAVNVNTQVCRKGGGLIEGLYATGCDAGSPWGDSYDVEFLGGSCTAWAVISGRIAATEAVARMGA